MGTTAGKAIALIVLWFARACLGQACSCMGPMPVCSVYWTTPTLFLGHVIGIDHVYDEPPTENVIGPGKYLVHFEVTKAYRGSVGQEVVVRTADQDSACGFRFEQGHDYLVYGNAASGDIETNHCTRTHEVTNTADDVDLHWINALANAPPGASVFGHIQKLQPNEEGGFDAAALAGVPVSIRGVETRQVLTDSDGNFHADGLAPGKYSVTAQAPREYAAFPEESVTLQDHACAEIPLSTRLDGHIRGRVFFADGSPATGVYLTAKIAGADPHEPWTWRATYAHSTSDGTFDFAPLAPGSYIFAVNFDFAGADGSPYYRKAFFPGTVNQEEATAISVGPGQSVDDLRFFLPPDSAKPSAPLRVTVIGFDGRPVARAEILAEDEMWGGSVTPVSATTEEAGVATVTLRPGSHYDVVAFVNLPDYSQACAEPVAVEAKDQNAPVLLVLSHHIGNCEQFKKPQAATQ